LLIINTCSVRQKSEDKVYGLGKDLYRKPNKPLVIMAGCMVGSATGERKRTNLSKLKERTPWVDEYINPTQIMTIPEILFTRGMIGEWALSKFDSGGVMATQSGGKHAFVNISQGCDNFCTFCVVPYARGREVSRSKEEILLEIEHLVSNGVTKVTLCGQNVNSWGLTKAKKFRIRTNSDQKLPFADLLRGVCVIAGIEQVDFLSSNPFDFTQDLIDTIAINPKISDYLHVAVQSGNNDILERMGRRHTIEQFYGLIKRIQKIRPNARLGTDIIVGFPGETREQFMDTVKLFEKIPFEVAFISIYSPREGTKAQTDYEDDVPLEEKKWRHAKLMEIWKKNKSKVPKNL